MLAAVTMPVHVSLLMLRNLENPHLAPLATTLIGAPQVKPGFVAQLEPTRM